MANTDLVIGDITQEAMRAFLNNLVFADKVNRTFSDRFGIEGAKVGDTINVRLPIQSVPTAGQGLQLQDMTERSIPLTLNVQYQRSIQFSSAELKLSIDNFADRYLNRLMEDMANQVDFDGLAQYKNIYNEVGTPGTLPTNDTTPLAAGQRLNEEAAYGDRNIVLSPAMNASIVHGLSGFFNPQATISRQFKKGMMYTDTLGFDWFMDQNVRVHTVGPLGGTPTVSSAAGQTGASLLTTGWTASILVLNVGDVFTIGSGATGVYAVNPKNFQSTGALRQFVVTAPVTSDGSGNATINISPSIITSGPYQTVVAAPAALATINVNGAAATATPRGLAFSRDAFAFVTAPLPLPDGVDMASRKSDKQLGLSMRCIRAYDINTDRFPLRIDLLGGWGTLRPQEAVRIAS